MGRNLAMENYVGRAGVYYCYHKQMNLGNTVLRERETRDVMASYTEISTFKIMNLD